MIVYLNELSLIKAKTDREAQSWLDHFLKVIILLKKIDDKLNCSYIENIHILDFQIHGSFSLRMFLSKHKNFRPLITSFFTAFNYISANPEFCYNGKECIGLGEAFNNNSLSLSLPSKDDWKVSLLKIVELTLFEMNNNIIEEEQICEVKNISTEDNYNLHNDFLLSRLSYEKNELIINLTFDEFVNTKDSIFENLIFLDDAINGLKTIRYNHNTFKTIKFILYGINQALTETELSHRDYYNKFCKLGKFTSESNTRKIEFDFNFLCPDGITRNFEYHYRFTPGPGRIHIAVDYENKKCYIGYIGPKIGKY